MGRDEEIAKEEAPSSLSENYKTICFSRQCFLQTFIESGRKMKLSISLRFDRVRN